MESYEIMKEVVDKVGAKQIAASLNVSTSLVYKWCERPKSDDDEDASGARNPLDRILALIESTESKDLLSWLCSNNGGFYVNNPKAEKTSVDSEYLAHTQRIIKDFSELLNAMSESIAHENAIDPTEAKRIRKEWESLKQFSEEFVCACEKGVFAS
jgi:hypothetical protein